jgi:hypothetical protein
VPWPFEKNSFEINHGLDDKGRISVGKVQAKKCPRRAGIFD